MIGYTARDYRRVHGITDAKFLLMQAQHAHAHSLRETAKANGTALELHPAEVDPGRLAKFLNKNPTFSVEHDPTLERLFLVKNQHLHGTVSFDVIAAKAELVMPKSQTSLAARLHTLIDKVFGRANARREL